MAQDSYFFPPASQCVICGSNEIKKAFSVHYWREYLIDFSDCRSCRATFANPMPTDLVISRGNDALVRYYQQGRTVDQEFRDARQAYLRGKLLAKKLSRWKRRGRVLEIGSNHGFFLLGFRENSEWEVEGLEISSELQSFVENELGIRCHLGTLEGWDGASAGAASRAAVDGTYDFIVCHDLIEHINRPQDFLKKLSALLSDGGRVQIITPNAVQDLAFTRRVASQGGVMTMLLNHIMYFAPSTLKLALEGVGLNLVQLYCYDLKHVLKDFGWFKWNKGMPRDMPQLLTDRPSIADALNLKVENTLSYWNSEKLHQLKTHRKVSSAYGFFKESLPRFASLHVPYPVAIGHEIYALAEKPVKTGKNAS